MKRLPNYVFPRPCKDCRVTKNESDFTSFVRDGKTYWFGNCKECDSVRAAAWHRDNPNPTKYADLSDEAKDRMIESSYERKKEFIALGICGDCGIRPKITRWHCGECKERHGKRGRKSRATLKDQVFAAYGGMRCQCECGCCVFEREFLTIDHIGGRRAHMHEKHLTGVPLYRWLRMNSFPPGFRVLCMNCNFAIGHSGYCPRAKAQQAQLVVGCILDVSPILDTLVEIVSDGSALVTPSQINLQEMSCNMSTQ